VTNLVTPPPSNGTGLLAPVTDLLIPPPSSGNGSLAPVANLLTTPPSNDGLVAPTSNLLTPTALGDQLSAAAPALPPLAAPTTPAAPLTDLTPPAAQRFRLLGILSPAPLAGPWAAPLAALARAALASTSLSQSPHAGVPTTRGNPPAPQTPEPGSSGGTAAGGAGSGVAFSVLLALLFSVAAFALQHFSRLRVPPTQWRQLAFVAVIERPG
jgi:hypothetical protein